METLMYLTIPPKRGYNMTCHEKSIPVLWNDCNFYYLLVHDSVLGNYPRVFSIYFGDKINPGEVWQH